MTTAPRSHITGVPGWESTDEQTLLYTLAQHVPAGGCIAEVGAEFGMSASLFCKGAKPDVQIYSIDLFPGDLLKQHRHNLVTAGFGTRFDTRSMQIKGDSKVIGAKWLDNNMPLIDLCFIDGDHSYNGAKADALIWSPLVKVGGYIAFHDCACATNHSPHYLHYEVQQAVNEWHETAKWVELSSTDTIRLFRRP